MVFVTVFFGLVFLGEVEVKVSVAVELNGSAEIFAFAIRYLIPRSNLGLVIPENQRRCLKYICEQS